MTSSEPSRRYSAGLRRLGFDERTTVFYDEHVEADAVHEQIASVDMCGSLVADEPELLPDVLFGAACSLAMDGVAARHLLGCLGGRPHARCTACATLRRLTVQSWSSVLAGRAQDLRGRARAARRAGRGEARPLVRAVAERLDARLPAAAQRDRVAARVDLGAVLVDAAGSRRGRSAGRPGTA